MSKATRTARRPAEQPGRSGWRSRTRAPTCTSPGSALYTQDLVNRTKDTLHAWPVQAPHAHATDHRPATSTPAYDVPGVVRVLTADDVPGVNDAGEKHDEPLFPTEVMFYGHAVCWVLGETLEAARQGAEAIEVDYEPLPSLIVGRATRSRPRASRATSARSAAATPTPALSPRRHRFSGEFEFGGQEHFYLETNAALALVDENGQIFVQSQHPAPVGDPGHRRARARACPRTSDRAVPADGRRLRRQGVPAARPRRDRGAGRDDHRTAGAAAAQPHPGHHDDRQAAPVPRHLGGRLRRRQADRARCGPR